MNQANGHMKYEVTLNIERFIQLTFMWIYTYLLQQALEFIQLSAEPNYVIILSNKNH